MQVSSNPGKFHHEISTGFTWFEVHRALKRHIIPQHHGIKSNVWMFLGSCCDQISSPSVQTTCLKGDSQIKEA